MPHDDLQRAALALALGAAITCAPALGAGQTGTSSVQYRSPDGIEYRSLPDSDAIRTARAAAAAMTVSIPLVAQRPPRTLLALLAHADDETAASPVLARYAREGVRVHMIVATDGSGGSGAQATLQRSENGPVGDALVKARAEEARCSAAAIGAQAPVLLAFADGKLGDYLADRTLLARLTDQIGAEIERLRPDVVITWGPDGGTGHPDHRLVSAIATQLLRTGAPGMPERLFYMSFPADTFALIAPQRAPAPLLSPRAHYFTMKVPFTPADLAAAQAAMACHGTQFNSEQLRVMQPGFARLWSGVIAFIPAVSSFTGDDLFR